MNNVGSQAKFTWTPSGVNYFACDPMLFILQWMLKNYHHFLNEIVTELFYGKCPKKFEHLIPYYFDLIFAFLCSCFLKYLVERQTV